MTSRPRYTVACLSGHGIGPELMAEASRAVRYVSRLHGFVVEERHPAFAGEALTRSGHALPPATRAATLSADAVLAASSRAPALAGVESQLDLVARVDRIAYGSRQVVTALSPLTDDGRTWTLARAFAAARASRARIASVGGDARWSLAFRAEAEQHDGVATEERSVADAARELTFSPESFDVVVAPAAVAEALVDLVACERRPRVVASGLVAERGPGVFAPAQGLDAEIAGQGVVNPASMLLAASLLLDEGLGERRAAESLLGAVLEASGNGARTPHAIATGVGATTREFGDVVLAAVPASLTTAEFFREAVA